MILTEQRDVEEEREPNQEGHDADGKHDDVSLRRTVRRSGLALGIVRRELLCLTSRICRSTSPLAIGHYSESPGSRIVIL